MNPSELKPGDVLIFSGEKGSWISEAIMFLAGAPVSHAAMVYTTNTELVEETPPAVRVAKTEGRFTGRDVYVNRLKGASGLDPVVASATRYVNREEPYAMSNLYLVGMILLYRKFTPNTPLQKLMIKLFKKLAGHVIEHINKRKEPGKLPMVCSQFVFQCFEDAGADYRLHLLKPVLLRAPLEGEGPREGGSLLDQVVRQVRRRDAIALHKLSAEVTPLTTEIDLSEDELGRQLVDALKQGGGTEGAALDEELVLAVSRFSEALYTAGTGTAVPQQALTRALSAGRTPDALNLLKVEEAYFVTPADLLDRCANLERVGVIES